jgi:ABC-type transport system involved in multi-copper enzyme maturation permease subunit
MILNPVLGREIKERFRTRRAPWFFFAWVLAMACFVYLIYLLAQFVAREQFGLGRLVATGFMGRFMFELTSLLLVTAVMLVVPGLAALSVVGERERQTLSLLQVTQLSPLQLIFGKLMSSLSYLLLLLVAVAPAVALPLLFGGITFGDLVGALAIVIGFAVVVGALSVWLSARARSSRGAVAGAYLGSLLLGVFAFAIMTAEIFLFAPDRGGLFGNGGRELYSTWINPYLAVVSAVDHPLTIRQDGIPRPFSPLETIVYRREGVRLSPQGWVEGIPPGGVTIQDGQQLVKEKRGPLGIRTLIVYGAISVLAILRAARIIRVPAKRPISLVRSRRATA